MSALMTAVVGLIIVSILETIVVAILILDRRQERDQYIQQAQNFLLSLEKRDEVLRQVSNRIADLQGEIKTMTGTLIGVARLVLDKSPQQVSDAGTKQGSSGS